jgi:hypothetical protein
MGMAYGVFIESVIIAAVVALGILVGGGALVRAFVISRRPSHHTARHSGASPVPPNMIRKYLRFDVIPTG